MFIFRARESEAMYSTFIDTDSQITRQSVALQPSHHFSVCLFITAGHSQLRQQQKMPLSPTDCARAVALVD
ncbi:hypothetical protein J6590_101380, partial [Homalodisca vitripennis]